MAIITRMAALVAIAASTLLITGCIPTREVPPARLTVEDLKVYQQRDIDQIWNMVGLPDELRPAEVDIETVGGDEWAVEVAECMTERGHPGYVAEGGGFSAAPEPRDDRESISLFLCFAGHQVDRAEYGAMSSASLDYLYDYYVAVLVPCLEAHGVDVITAPPRKDAATLTGSFVGWNPYYEMGERFNPTISEWDRFVFEACPPFPKGEAFDPYREVWGPLPPRE